MARFATPLIIMLLLLGISCSSAQSLASHGQGKPAPAQLVLPAPDSLKALSYTETDLVSKGSAFVSEVSQLVTASGDFADFAPAYDPAAPALADVSYALYDFRVIDYDRDEAVYFTWNTTGDYGMAYVAFANFPGNTWHWTQLDASNVQPFSAEFNIRGADDHLFVLVAFIGTAPWQLAQLRIGDIPPAPPAPLNVVATDGTFNASIGVGWQKNSQAAYYVIYRDVQDTPLVTVGDVDSYFDMDVDDPDAHNYWVRAGNEGGVSDFSNVDIGWRGQTPLGPTAVDNVNATDAAYPDRVKVIWFKVLGASGYEIFRDDMFTPIATVGNLNLYLDYDVTDGLEHTYWVRAKNNFGTSAFKAHDVGSLDPSPQGQGDWPMYGRDFSHTCNSSLSGPATNNLLWSADLSEYATQTVKAGYSSPVTAENGAIYISCDKGLLFALNPDGSFRWKLATPGFNLHTPAVGPDGTIYIASGGTALYAAYSYGELKWTYDAADSLAQLSGPLTLDADGNIYVAGNGVGLVYSINPDGESRTGWPFAINGAPIKVFTPVLSRDGLTLYGGAGVVLGTPYMHAVGLDGSEVWNTTLLAGSGNHPSIDLTGNILMVGGNNLTSYPSDGSASSWSYATDHVSGAVGVTTGTGSLFFGSNTTVDNEDGKFTKLAANGSYSWENAQTRGVVGAPAIDSAGNVYYGGRDGFVYAYEPDNTLIWSYEIGAEIWSSPAIGPNGVLYIGADDGKLYAFGAAAE